MSASSGTSTATSGQIALQILAPSSSKPGSSGPSMSTSTAGGFLGEWAQRVTTLGCVAACTLLMLGAATAVAVGALVFVYKSGSTTECLGSFAGISFSYLTWLRVMGWTFIGSLALEVIFVFAHGWTGTYCTSKAATTWGFLMYLFQTAWAVIGAVLYWEGSTSNCSNGSQIQLFALSLFIIQTTVIVCLFCGRRAAEAVS
jgi:hypothetical protein